MKRHVGHILFYSIITVAIYASSVNIALAVPRERLTITTMQSQDYTRFLFHHENRATFLPEIKGNQLIVTLDKPFWTNLTPIVEKASRYVKSADISRDGKTIRFTLKNPETLAVRPFLGEHYVGLDLVEITPAPASTQIAGGQLVFEKAAIQQNIVTQPSLADDIEAKETNQIAAIDSALVASIELAQAELTPQPAIPTQEASSPAIATDATGEANESVETTAPAAAEATTEETVSDSDRSASPPARLPAAEETAVSAAATDSTNINENGTTEAATELTTEAVVQEEIAAPATEETTAPAEPTAAVVAEQPAEPAAPVAQALPSAETIPSAIATPAEQDVTNENALPVPNYYQLTFPWDKPVASAIFRRGSYSWFIFNEYAPIEMTLFLKKHAALFEAGEQIENRQYTILRLKHRFPFSYSATAKSNEWTITATTRNNPPAQPLPVRIKSSNLHGTIIEVQSTQFAEPLKIIDPLIGDEMLIMASYEAEAGVGIARMQTDFNMLKSAQGLALVLKADDVFIDQKQFGIAISGPTNRITSSESQALREKLEELKRQRELAKKAKKDEVGEKALLKFTTWQGNNSFSEMRQELEAKIIEANWENKNGYRLALAQFYLAHSMEVEALSVIKIMREYDPAYANRADVLLVEGAANYLAGEYPQAYDSFAAINTEKMEEVKAAEVNFWKTASELKVNQRIKMDKFVSRHPLKDEKKDSAQSEDKVEITKLILDTSSRLLKMIKKIDPKLATSEEIQTLESTARFVSSHYQDEIKRFGESELYQSNDVFEANDESQWWNTSGVRPDGNYEDLNYLQNRLLFLEDYPDSIYNDFALLALEERLENNDVNSAERILETFRESDDERFQNSLAYLQGLFYAKDDEIDLALEAWEPLKKAVFDRYNRARSQFASTGLQLKTGRINLDQAIENFNKIRMVWRGDVLELNLLKLLGEFYMDQRQYMQAFTTWREVLTNFPGSEDALLIAKKMNQEFVYLFNSGGASELSQLEALTLYYEFRELTPVGKQGDQMILKLVDRLVEVDLLDRASALLTHLVRFRLTGEEKHEASTRLAEIYLMANEYEKALDALNATKSERIDPELSDRRRYIKTKAFINLKQNNQALALLRGDETMEASFLRADIYWRNKVWRKVIDELEYPFKEIIREERPLTTAESKALNKIAIAYALTGNKKRLKLLREDFFPYVSTPQQQLLAFVADDNNSINYRDLEGSLGLNKMENFIQNYMNMADGGPQRQ